MSRLFAGLSALIVCLALASTAQAQSWPPVPQVPESAQGADAFDEGNPRVEKSFIVDAEQVRPGDTVAVGIILEMDPDWHVYWRDSGEGGMSTEASFDAEQAEVGPVQWPEPTVYHEAGGEIITFGYGGKTLLFAELTVADDAADELRLEGVVDYLVCKVDCIPGRAELSRTLKVGDETIPDGATRPWFEQARGLVPQSPAATDIDVSVRYSQVPIEKGETFRVELSVVGCEDVDDDTCPRLGPVPQRPADAFVFEKVPKVTMSVARASAHPEAASGWFIELEGRASRDNFDGDERLRGVVRLRDDQDRFLATTVDELFPRSDSEAAQALAAADGTGGDGAPADSDGADGTSTDAPTNHQPPQSLFYFLLLAFMGGALLNLMPCVFPVLAIKVFAFINLVQEERSQIYSHSAAYTGGIVASMLTLATAVIALQVLGTQVGWGFQFQEPRFIAVVGGVLVIFALNLFGVFEVTLSPGKLQEVTEAPLTHRRSFGEGVLAVVLATPCSAPFLGTAVGFALASSPAVILATFAALGLGLAAPFVVLTLVPGAAKILPRPGPWMGYFKEFLGFALLGTVIWLAWLIGEMSGGGGVTQLLAFLLACALGAWLFGRLQFKSGILQKAGVFAALMIIVATGYFTLRFDETNSVNKSTASTEVADGEIDWQPWSEEAVQQELAAGRPVFVDFTADWCITCKVNKRTVIETPEVVATIEDHEVAMFIADWTRRDDTIRQKLAEFGKAGVPMYLLYSPDSPQDPKVLPEVLTRQRLQEAMAGAQSQ